MAFHLFQAFLPHELFVARRNKAPLARHGVDVALLFKLFVGALGGDDADAQIFCEIADGGQRLVRLEPAARDLALEGFRDLKVDGVAADCRCG